MPIFSFRQVIRGVIRKLGYDIIPIYNSPRISFLGMNKLNVGMIIDIGANRGQFAKTARVSFPNASIHCFEPLPMAADVLKSWAGTQAGKVVVHCTALGSAAKISSMWLHIDHDASSSLLSTTIITDTMYPQTANRRKVDVDVQTLDSYSYWTKKDQGALIVKIDVQGYEAEVIEGGKNTIRCADVVIIEISVMSLYEGQPTFEFIVNELMSCGLRFIGVLEQIHDFEGQPVYFDAVFVRTFPFLSS